MLPLTVLALGPDRSSAGPKQINLCAARCVVAAFAPTLALHPLPRRLGTAARGARGESRWKVDLRCGGHVEYDRSGEGRDHRDDACDGSDHACGATGSVGILDVGGGAIALSVERNGASGDDGREHGVLVVVSHSLPFIAVRLSYPLRGVARSVSSHGAARSWDRS